MFTLGCHTPEYLNERGAIERTSPLEDRSIMGNSLGPKKTKLHNSSFPELCNMYTSFKRALGPVASACF